MDYVTFYVTAMSLINQKKAMYQKQQQKRLLQIQFINKNRKSLDLEIMILTIIR